MGSILIDDICNQDSLENEPVGTLSASRPDGNSYRPFKVFGLSSDQSTPTGLKDEIILLSWLIVLLRTRDGSQISFEWAYKGLADGFGPEPLHRCLSMHEVVTSGMQSRVEQVATTISRHNSTVAQNHGAAVSHPASLLLSTGSLSKTSEEANDEGVLQLEVRFGNGCIQIRPLWYSKTMPQYTVMLYIETLVDTIKTCISSSSSSIEDCIGPTTFDRDEVWRWNHVLPPSYNFCMHDMISEKARRYPDKVAISSWDGNLTYAQVDQYSTFIASLLIETGVKLHDIVPVCSEKSRWTIVAVLAVMKAGATFVLMDPTLPLARLQNMAEQVSAKTMLTSRQQYGLSKSVIPSGKITVVEAETFSHFSSLQAVPKLPAVPSSTLMYIIFTSGSTGTPKGVKISHETYTSSAIPRAEAVGYTESSRVLDFASYAFDVSIDSMLLTLGNGGCLCIPSDEDRVNDINGVIRGMQINYAGLTPSVARILDPDVITSISGLGLGGEAAAARDVTRWGQETRIIIGYGPCECTIGCTINSSAATGRSYISIGRGNGANIWIVNPSDHEILMPVGAVGELLVEGPIVGQGYLNDPEKTAAAFIQDPSWLSTGHKAYPGRRGRLYKTGDLGKYDPDGSGGIVFVGRKDTQVKLRGQRVELGEIESQLKARLPSNTNVIAEVIVPPGMGGQPTLVAFVAPQPTKGHGRSDLKLAELDSEFRTFLAEANTDLKNVLPRYMVPTVYIPVNCIPSLISGKTDRKQLRQFGATLDLRQLDYGTTSSTTRQLSDIEQRMQRAWSQALKTDPELIRPDDNFFMLGGDSLTAMRLVSVCREQGLDLTVANAFSNPTLSAMASILSTCTSQMRTETPAFSMIVQAADSACLEAAQACKSEWAMIEDIYPCTPTQESLFTFSLKSTKAYIAQRVSCIPLHVDLDDWKRAWESVVSANPILRTRLAQLSEPGLQQVVMRGSISWRYSTDLAQYLEKDCNEKMDLGQNLARYAIIDNIQDGKRYMVWTVHHVLYDGWSEPLVLEKVSNALQNQYVESQSQMKDFVRYVRGTDETSMQDFWRKELKDAVGPQFPHMPSRDYLPTPDSMLEHHITLETSAGLPFTMATLIRGAWALVASQYTGSNDIVFGETLTGRDIPLAGVESIVGPLIATIPIRIQIDRTGTVEAYLQTIQRGISARAPYQHMGWQNIRKVSRDAQYACEAPTGLVIQPEPEYMGSELGFDQGDVLREALHFNPYPLMLACGIGEGGFRICASFDSTRIEVTQMKRIFAQLETVCVQLSNNLSRRVEQISCLPATELNDIWRWNQTPPLSWDESLRRLRVDTSINQGSIYPRAINSWVCDPRNPSLLSAIGCVGELWLEGDVLSGDIVESPPWLVAGSSTYVGRAGRVQSTGDMVQLQEDGALTFIGRKETFLLAQGHAMDFADVEAHLARHLPQTIRAVAAVVQLPSDTTQKSQKQELVVLVEQQRPLADEDGVDLMSAKSTITGNGLGSQSFETTICAVIPISLGIALKKLDKFIQDSLPSYMVPFAYVVVDKLPTEKGQTDHSLLNQLASNIPLNTLIQLSDGFKKLKTSPSAQTSLTATEIILRSAWAKILGMSPDQIDVDDNFFRLGGDSVLAMKLVSNLRAEGHGLTVADIFQHMRLVDAAKVLKLDQNSEEKGQPYIPFSMLNHLDIELFLSEIRPKLADPRWSIRDAYPVTDSQALDVRATIQTPRTSIQYTMLYFDRGIDRQQLVRACEKLVKTHDILRTVFIEHESNIFQLVIDELDTSVTMHQTDLDLEQYVAELCTADIELNLHLGSSFIKMFHVEGKDGQECLIIGLSHAQYDGTSLPILLRDLENLYTGKDVVNSSPFSSYISHISSESINNKAHYYWRNLLVGSSLAILDETSVQSTDKSLFQAKPVDISRRPEDITTANLLTAAWALILARRLRKPDITFGGITSGRNINMTDVENVMGPCYQFTPTRVSFDPQWEAMDLLRAVQKQSAESAAHDVLGFEKISKQCTQWPSEAGFFDSIVHHQDFEDFDTMPFAGTTCRVEILNPHGDAAYPFKAVSFVQGGQTHVGFVGSERDAAFVDAALDELVATIQELATCRPEQVLLDGEIFRR